MAADHAVRSRIAATVSAVLMFGATAAAALEFEPGVTVGITFTDNVGLASENKEDETILRLEPFFTLSHETGRVTADASYQMQAFRYVDIEESEIYHQFDGMLRGEILPEFFFLEVGADRSQSIIDANSAIPQSNLPISGNRQDRDEFYIEPSFRYDFGPSITARGNYRNSWVDYGSGASLDAENRDALFTLDNYGRGQGLSWALRYEWLHSDYDEEDIPTWEYQQASAELGYWVSDALRIFASGGKESAWDTPLDSSLEDTFWEAGAAYKAGERLNAEFAAGERTFGSSWRGRLNMTLRRGTLTLSYDETPTTQGRNRYQRYDPDEPIFIEDNLSQPGLPERYVSRRGEARLDFDLPKTTLSVAVFTWDRIERTAIDGTPLPDEEQSGVRAAASYRLGAKTTLEGNASWTERQYENEEGPRDIYRASLAALYALGPRSFLTLQYEYQREDGEESLFGRDYDANFLSFLFTRTF